MYFRRAAENSKEILSGQGADELYSDHGFNGIKFSQDSSLAGAYPDDLNTAFPWANLFGGVNQCYLLKDEMMTRIHSMEGRYPSLDKYVFQEFLSINNSK